MDITELDKQLEEIFKPYHVEKFHIRVMYKEWMQIITFGAITIEDRYTLATDIYSNFKDKVPIEELEKYNPVKIEEQRVLEAFKKDLTTH